MTTFISSETLFIIKIYEKFKLKELVNKIKINLLSDFFFFRFLSLVYPDNIFIEKMLIVVKKIQKRLTLQPRNR